MSTAFENDPEFNDEIPKPRPRRRIWLIELLFGIGIIAMLLALLLPENRSPSPAARRAHCGNNLKQIALALSLYAKVYNALPPACTVDASGRPLHSWRTLILPYLEKEQLYRAIDLSRPWDHPANATALNTVVLVYLCPNTDAGEPFNKTTYLALTGRNACFLPREPRRLAEITDDHAATLMVIEAGDDHAVPWMAPLDADPSLVMHLRPTTQLHHAGGTNASFVEGSVRFLRNDTPSRVRGALLSIASGDDEIAKTW